MKHVFFTFFVALLSLTLNAQICDPLCTPDESCVENFEGNGMICPVDLPVAMQNVYYDETVTVIPPKNFEGYSLIGAIRIDEVNNLPEGVTWCKSQDIFNVTTPLTRYCAQLKGTPTTPGNYQLSLKITPYLNFFGTLVEQSPVYDDTSLLIVVLPYIEPPVADFIGNPTTVQEGQQVSFEDLSSNEPTSWLWTFDGGNPPTSDLPNPTVTYATDGIYNVSLTVANEGGEHSVTKEGYITVTPLSAPPVANFVGNPTTVVVGGTVSFTDLSTNNPTSWEWIFDGGDPASSPDQNPTVTYNTAGIYTVKLTATNVDGSDTKTITNYITVVEDGSLTADFTVDKTIIEAGDTVNFTDQSIGAVTSWNWEFIGGNPFASTDQNPSVVYEIAGVYDVKLTVSDGTNTSEKIKSAYITVSEPLVADFVGNPTSVEIGGTVVFTDQSTGGVTSWNWQFPGGNPATSILPNPSVVYSTEGTYDVTLTVGNGANQDEEVKTGYITVIPSGIEGTEFDFVKIYPNPAHDNIVVEAQGLETVSIIDVLGKVVYTKTTNSDKEFINVSKLQKANYFIKVKTNSREIVKTISVK
ncbi:MAG: PKD domain protein [Ignavibacteria bacterium ADurb.Bin266]|nr:MAG: PKD domain protein [Ignavibacteria bacterium ADurb.Bin266]